MYIYILKCNNDKYYIGYSKKSIEYRIKQHFENEGCEWTRLHKPIKIIKVIENVDKFDEDKYTKIYMKKYGIDNVRGGSYSQIILSSESINLLKKEIMHAENKCFNCRSKDHYITECTKNKVVCYKCNKLGHYANECYASTNYDKDTEIICYKCKRLGYYTNECYASTNIYGKRIYH